MKAQPGLFDEENRLATLSKLGDNLEKLDEAIEWERFRPILTDGFRGEEPAKAPGGRPPYDVVLRFKILVLQKLYNLSDDQTEFQINDRRTFMRFLGLRDYEKVPDAKSIWGWRETLSRRGVFDRLFKRFWKQLKMQNIAASKGTIVDATFVDTPRQRNSRDENDDLKKGDVPEEWQKPAQESKLRQKDLDARWAKKGQEKHFGYKNHVKVDRKSKLILKYTVTDASVHDSQALSDLLDKTDAGKSMYADSAYSGKKVEKELGEQGVKSRIQEKGYRNRPLTERQKKRNRAKSRVRARIEHVFGFMTRSMGGLVVRCIGLIRAKAAIALGNLVYNLCRYRWITRPRTEN
jgi:IS5 family transposase